MSNTLESLYEERIASQETIFDFKDELILSKNIYNTNEKRKGLEALAQTLQNLLIFERGTFPNQPNLGVGVENYQFEFIDTTTIDKIRSKTEDNIRQFIPTNIHINFDIDILKNNYGDNVLLFSFVISNNRNRNTEQIGILFGMDKDNSKIVSRIVL